MSNTKEELEKVIKLDLRKFNQAEEQVTKGIAALVKIEVVNDEDDLEKAMTVLKGAKSVENLIEKKRKEITQPVNAEIKKVNAYAKGLVSSLPTEVSRVKKEVVSYQQRQREIEEANRIAEAKRVADEEKHRQEGLDEIARQKAETESISDFLSPEELEKRNNDIAELELETPKEEIITPIEIIETKVKGIRKTWKHEVTDSKLVPRKYLEVIDKLIRDDIKLGLRDIPGVRIFEEESLAIRA